MEKKENQMVTKEDLGGACLYAETDAQHLECHVKTCKCQCHGGKGGVCDCSEKEAVEDAKRFEKEKAYWHSIILKEKIKDIEGIRRQIIQDYLEHRISESEQLKSIFYINQALAILENE